MSKVSKEEFIELFHQGKSDKELCKILQCTLKNIKRKRRRLNLSRQKPYNKEDFWKVVTCLNCGKEFEKSVAQLKQTPNSYCSRSCAAQLTNRIYPKRKTKKICTKCDKRVVNYRTSLCEEHLKEYKEGLKEAVKFKTVGEYRNKESVKDKHPSWRHSHIRGLAKSWFKHLCKLPCANCGYDKHVELCHIKSVASFNDDATLGEINNEKNIIQLCPNCHWEFDNGLLSLDKM